MDMGRNGIQIIVVIFQQIEDRVSPLFRTISTAMPESISPTLFSTLSFLLWDAVELQLVLPAATK
jgi:hypothetical protein